MSNKFKDELKEKAHKKGKTLRMEINFKKDEYPKENRDRVLDTEIDLSDVKKDEKVKEAVEKMLEER